MAKSPSSAARPKRSKAGIVYVPEERGKQGAIIGLPIFQNVSLPSLKKTSRRLPALRGIRWRANIPSGSTCAPPRSSQDVGTLSGGNQQKVVIAKWLATQAQGDHPR
jgi:rhamnose transport system ATP-binding protein